MYNILDVEISENLFRRRILPVGLSLAESNWRANVFFKNNAFLAAIFLEIPNINILIPFAYDQEALTLFRGPVEFGICSKGFKERVYLDLFIKGEIIDEFVKLISVQTTKNIKKDRPTKAQQEFIRILRDKFSTTSIAIALQYRWSKKAGVKTKIRVG